MERPYCSSSRTKPQPAFSIQFIFHPVDYAELMDAQHIGRNITDVSVLGSWDNEVYPLERLDDTFTGVIWLAQGTYTYKFLVDGYETPDLRLKQNIVAGESTLLVSTQNAVMYKGKALDCSATTVVGPIYEPSHAFEYQHCRQLADLEIVNIVDVQEDLPIPRFLMIVLSNRRILLQETPLPKTWLWRGILYQVVVEFVKPGDDNHKTKDTTTWNLCKIEMGNLLAVEAQLLSHTAQTSMESFIHAHKNLFEQTKGRVEVFLHEVFSDMKNDVAIVIVMTSWSCAAKLEKLNITRWAGLEVLIIRDKLKELQGKNTEPVFSQHLMVGSRGGGSGMTIGAIVHDLREPDNYYMLQCAHGYNKPGNSAFCYYPPVEFVDTAMDEIDRKAGYLGAGSHKTLAQQQYEVLEAAYKETCDIIVTTVANQGNANTLPDYPRVCTSKRFKENSTTAELVVGEVSFMSPDMLDTAVIQLRLGTFAGSPRRLHTPINTLINPQDIDRKLRTRKLAEGMPNAIKQLTTKSRLAIIKDYSRGKEKLGKFGAASGWTQFNTRSDSTTYQDGIVIFDLVSLDIKAGKIGVESGDSSSPVIDSQGVMVGMISSMSESGLMGYMIPIPAMREWWQSKGLDFVLA